MKKSLHLASVFIFLFILFNNLFAAPFDTGMITLTQPNNVTFTGRIWGDEFIYWMETEDGYRFVETFEGWYYYATLDQNGEYTPTNYEVGIDSPPSSSYKLERSQARLIEIADELEQFEEQIEINRQWFAQKQAEAHEQPITIKVGIILIEFTDTTHYVAPYRPYGYTTVDFDSMMFSYNFWIGEGLASPHPEREEVFGSFRDYWHQMSRGKLRIEGRVANHTDQNGVPEWLTATHGKGFYYNLPYGNRTLAIEAITKALEDSLIDTTNTSSPKYFDKLVIVYADEVRQNGALAVNGDKIGGKFILLAERSSYKLRFLDDYSFTHIGIYAHEFGHNIGLHDEYYIENPYPIDWPPYNGYPTDIYNFCLMAFGIYNGPLSKGECPATLSAYNRIDKKWVTPTVIPSDTTNFIVEYNYNSPKYYRINPVEATNCEHFILENKKRTGFDLYIPGDPVDSVNQPGRLLVWHHLVDLRCFGQEDYDRITITPADDSLDKETQLTDFFPKQLNPNFQNLNDITNPGAILGGSPNPYQSNERPAHFALNGIQKLSNGNTLIDEIRLNYQYVTYEISGSWQTVSVPVVPSKFNYHVSAIFPTVDTNSVYNYQPPYVQVKTLENGPGYYAKFSTPAQTITFSGTPVEYLEIPVNTGWNIAGSIFYKVPVPNICTEPPGIITGQMYYYNGGYHYLTANDSISPGMGFWVKTTSNGNIILDRYAEPCELPKITAYPEIDLEKMDKFMVSDSAGNVQTLFVSNTDIDSSIINLDMELPPFFPESDFDSRFEYNEFVKKVSADSGLIDLNILVHTEALPVSLSWEINPENGINYTFIEDSILGKEKNIETLIGQASFNKLSNNRIELFAKVDGNTSKNLIPKEYNLYQNYPNPFNPTTIIKYDIPKTGLVSLKVYDVLGSEVATLVNEEKPVGRYEASFDASSLASGVYIYRLSVNDFVNVKKMVMLK